MAGIMRVEDWHDASSFVDPAEAVITTNVLGPVRLIGHLVEHLQSRPEATIVTVSSWVGFTPLKAVPSDSASKAAIHMSESIRLQLADTSVGVLEIVPPAVRTSLLPGQEDSEWAVPLDGFVAEVMELIETQPDATDILVERVKFLRHSEARGDYREAVAALNEADP